MNNASPPRTSEVCATITPTPGVPVAAHARVDNTHVLNLGASHRDHSDSKDELPELPDPSQEQPKAFPETQYVIEPDSNGNYLENVPVTQCDTTST